MQAKFQASVKQGIYVANNAALRHVMRVPLLERLGMRTSLPDVFLHAFRHRSLA